MKVSGFDCHFVWSLIILIIGSAIAFVVLLIRIRLKGVNAFRGAKRDEVKKNTAGHWLLFIPCCVLPVAGLGAGYYFEFSFQGKVISPLIGFFVAGVITAIIAWRMAKKDNFNRHCRGGD